MDKTALDDRLRAVPYQVFRSFKCAFDGLMHVLLTQRNMRFHFFAALLVMSLAVILNLEPLEKCFIFTVISFVFTMETINTSVENFTDLISPERHESARIAKDTAAAAVLVVSIGSIMAAGYILAPRLYRLILSSPFSAYAVDFARWLGILAAVLLCWGAVALKWPERFFTPVLSAGGAFIVAQICREAGDPISFFALLFFSLFLFRSLTRNISSGYALAGQIAGAFGYGVWRLTTTQGL